MIVSEAVRREARASWWGRKLSAIGAGDLGVIRRGREERLLERIRNCYGPRAERIGARAPDAARELLECWVPGLGNTPVRSGIIPAAAGFEWSDATSMTLQIWVRADMGITIGTGVSAWADQSGNANDFVQGTGGAQPAYSSSDSTLGGRASVQGDGSSDLMTNAYNPPLPGTSPIFVWTIGKAASWTNADTYFSGASTSILRVNQQGSTPLVLATNGVASASIAMTVGTWFRTENSFANDLAIDYFRVGSTTTSGANLGNNDAGSVLLFSRTGGAGSNFGNFHVGEFVLLTGSAAIPTELSLADDYAEEYYGGSVTL